jgi:hypothetical protein
MVHVAVGNCFEWYTLWYTNRYLIRSHILFARVSAFSLGPSDLREDRSTQARREETPSSASEIASRNASMQSSDRREKFSCSSLSSSSSRLESDKSPEVPEAI